MRAAPETMVPQGVPPRREGGQAGGEGLWPLLPRLLTGLIWKPGRGFLPCPLLAAIQEQMRRTQKGWSLGLLADIERNLPGQ